MKLMVLNPLAAVAALNGMRRPLDRHDFPGGHIPDSFMASVPAPGRLRSLDWGGGDYGGYEALCANVGLLTGLDAAYQDTYATNLVNTTTQGHILGTVGIDKVGRIFRYASAGASDLVVGNIVQSAAPIANHLALTAAAQNVGDGSLTAPIVVTPGATAGAANLYAEGFLGIDTTPGNGYSYRIAGHPAIVSSTAFNLYLDPDDRIQVALTTSSRYGLFHSPWRQVIQTPTTITAMVVGGVVSIITGNGTAENFGWLQTRGHFAALINGTPAVTAPIINGATTAGTVDVWTSAAQPTSQMIGHMRQVGVSTKNNGVFLTID
jgi:hypothetical protein